MCRKPWVRCGDREGGGDMWLYFLDILTLACVVRELGLWLKGSLFRSRTTLRQILALVCKDGYFGGCLVLVCA